MQSSPSTTWIVAMCAPPLLRSQLFAGAARRSSGDGEILYAQSETMDSPETLADIAIFAAVIREGSFTRAAEKLELSTSQVSKCVNRLERTSAPGCCTARRAAFVLPRPARHSTRTARQRSPPSKTRSSPYPNFRCTTWQAEDQHLNCVRHDAAPRVIRDLSAQYPELEVELVLEDRHVDLVKEGIDVAIRITGEAPDSGLVYRKLAPNRQVICASPDYIGRRGLPRTPDDLANHNCIAHSARTTPRTWHLTGPDGGQISVPINGRPTINSALAVRQAALEGLGIIELNSYLVGEDIAAGAPRAAAASVPTEGLELLRRLRRTAFPCSQDPRVCRRHAGPYVARAAVGCVPQPSGKNTNRTHPCLDCGRCDDPAGLWTKEPAG